MIEGLFLPANSSFSGLSPLQQPESSPDVNARDLFGGIVDRLVLGPRDLLTLRVGVMNHRTNIRPAGAGDAVLRPDGWQQNWFSAVDTSGTRPSVSITWDRSGLSARGTHTISVTGDVQFRTMSSSISHQPIRIEDDLGRLTRSIEFAPLTRPIETDDARGGAGFRDLWDVTARLQLDLDLRLDGYAGSGVTPSPRIGVRYTLDAEGRTTLKASAGRFVGRPPLGAQAFGQFPRGSIDHLLRPPARRAGCTLTARSGAAPEFPRSDGRRRAGNRAPDPSGARGQAAVRVRKSIDLPTVMVGLRAATRCWPAPATASIASSRCRCVRCGAPRRSSS